MYGGVSMESMDMFYNHFWDYFCPYGLVYLLAPLKAYYRKVKVGVLRPVQQPGSCWDRSSELPLVGLEPTEVTAYD